MMRRILVFLFLLSGAWSLYSGLAIHAKAMLAQVLLQRAWSASIDSGDPVRPWPWADTWPLARLVIPRLDISHIVLAGVSGQSLAFGPGLFYPAGERSSMPVIAGHRDTHFRLLQQLQPGDVIELYWLSGQRLRYFVTARSVVDSSQALYWPQQDSSQLLLVTCFPFNAVDPGGPLRYLVSARREQQGTSL